MVEAGDQWEIGEDTDCSDEAAEIIRTRLLGQCSQLQDKSSMKKYVRWKM